MIEYARLNDKNEIEIVVDFYKLETKELQKKEIIEKLNTFYTLNHCLKNELNKTTEEKTKQNLTKVLYEEDRNKLLADFKAQQENIKKQILNFLQGLLTSVDKIFLNSINPGKSSLEKSANTYTELTSLINSKIIEIETTTLNQDKGENK